MGVHEITRRVDHFVPDRVAVRAPGDLGLAQIVADQLNSSALGSGDVHELRRAGGCATAA